VTVPREAGAIHDIGYRHYDGPRLGLGYIARSLAVQSLRGAFGLGRSARSKVMPLLLLGVMLVPAVVIAAVVILTEADELPLEYTSYPVRLGSVIVIFLASQAPQSVSRDLRFRVVALYFSRPLTRRAYVHAKLVAMTVAMFLLMAAPLLVLFAGALLAKMPFWDNARGVAEGLAGAAMFALVLSSVGLVIAAFTPRRGIGVAAIVATLAVAGAVSAAVQGIANDQGHPTVAGWAGLASPLGVVDGVQVWLFDTPTSVVVGPPGRFGGPVFALVAMAIVAGCYLLLLRRYRRVAVA
jgi:ABC-2 type transport system permease protein